MLFKIKTSDFGVKQNILSEFVRAYFKADTETQLASWALPFDYFPDSVKSKKDKSQVNRCQKALCVSGHLEMITNPNGQVYIGLTRKGLDAYNSEEFGTLEREERRKIINNRYTIAFGFITAFGVLFSIFKDTLLNEGSKKQEMKIVIEQRPKMPVRQIDTIVVYVDSSRISK